MKIVLGSDHAGFDLKQNLVHFVCDLGHEILDVGTHSKDAVDYPDFSEAVGSLWSMGARIEAFSSAAVAWGLRWQPIRYRVSVPGCAMIRIPRTKASNTII